MKKTKINLLTSREDYFKVERSIQLVRLIVVIYTFAFIIGVFIFVFFQYLQNREIQELIDQKKVLLSSLNNYNDQEAKLVFVAKKIKSYDKFILDDARFLPYYNLLNKTLKSTSETSIGSSSATLSSFAIDKDRVVTFELTFDSVIDMVDSFKYIESDDFLRNFEKLSLNGLTMDTSRKDNSLSFSGKFKEINEKTN